MRNYANTLLNKSHNVGAYIRHGSINNLFDSLPGEEVTLGVAALSGQNDHFMSSIGTNHPFKNILLLTYDSTDVETQTIPAPGGDVTVSVEASEQGPMMHLCEVAGKVKTPWFVVATNYHIINAPVSLLMHMGQPVLPYLLASSSYCMDRPDCNLAVFRLSFGTLTFWRTDAPMSLWADKLALQRSILSPVTPDRIPKNFQASLVELPAIITSEKATTGGTWFM